MSPTQALKLFQDQPVRTVWNEGEEDWYFSIVDVVAVLTESKDPTQYLKRLRSRDSELGLYLGTNCTQVAMKTSTGKIRKTLAGNSKHVLRIIQSIPSKKAEPFKQWLAQVGAERIEDQRIPEDT